MRTTIQNIYKQETQIVVEEDGQQYDEIWTLINWIIDGWWISKEEARTQHTNMTCIKQEEKKKNNNN